MKRTLLWMAAAGSLGLAACSAPPAQHTSVPQTPAVMAATPLEEAAPLEGFTVKMTVAPDPPQPGQPAQLTFTVYGPDQPEAITKYDVVHEKQLHLLLVSRDLAEFQHEHPVMDPDGIWRIPLTFPQPGPYRFFLDITPTGQSQQVLRQDVTVPGPVQPQPLKLDRSPQLVQGMKIELLSDPAVLTVGSEMLTFRITENGKPVKNLEPYLGAMGHLVIVDRSAEQFLHAHPLERGAHAMAGHDAQAMHAGLPAGTRGGPEVAFHTEFTVPGTYKLWGQFQRAGKVFVAPFVVEVK